MNVGAGAGSYEPTDLKVTAVAPSSVMLPQHPPTAASAVQVTAENLPFADHTFDASMAVLTIHHWTDVEAGLAELVRVVRRRVVIVTFERRVWPDQSIVRVYLPAGIEDPSMPELGDVLAHLPPTTVEPILVPRDCTDRMSRRPLGVPRSGGPRTRAASSVWHQLPAAVLRASAERPST